VNLDEILKEAEEKLKNNENINLEIDDMNDNDDNINYCVEELFN
jgi:hypothetical protein